MHLDSSNGILSMVPGECVAEALSLLPPIATADDRVYEVVIDALHLGPVRIFARRQQVRHGKHRHWYWSAFRAEAATGAEIAELHHGLGSAR